MPSIMKILLGMVGVVLICYFSLRNKGEVQMSNFDKAIEFTFNNEGTFTDNDADLGGQTNLGVTLHLLKRWREDHQLPTATVDDLKKLSKDEAKDIYKYYFWDFLHLDRVADDSIATAIFDVAVNMGPCMAAKLAQKTAGLPEDGIVGPVTLTRLNSLDPKTFLIGFANYVTITYQQIAASHESQKVFLAGWLNRAVRIAAIM